MRAYGLRCTGPFCARRCPHRVVCIVLTLDWKGSVRARLAWLTAARTPASAPQAAVHGVAGLGFVCSLACNAKIPNSTVRATRVTRGALLRTG